MALTKVGKEGITGISNSSNATAITIDSSENVGIGVTSMTNKLVLPNASYFAMQDSSGAESLAIRANSSNAMELLTGGGVKASILSSGGITFNGDTAAANALDDYEEGTWTAGFAGSSTTATGYYTKVGRNVFITVYGASLNVTSTPTAAISGLPFTNNGGYTVAAITHDTYSNNSYNGYFGSGSTVISPIQDGTVSGSSAISGNPKYIMVSGTYITNS